MSADQPKHQEPTPEPDEEEVKAEVKTDDPEIKQAEQVQEAHSHLIFVEWGDGAEAKRLFHQIGGWDHVRGFMLTYRNVCTQAAAINALAWLRLHDISAFLCREVAYIHLLEDNELQLAQQRTRDMNQGARRVNRDEIGEDAQNWFHIVVATQRAMPGNVNVNVEARLGPGWLKVEDHSLVWSCENCTLREAVRAMSRVLQQAVNCELGLGVDYVEGLRQAMEALQPTLERERQVELEIAADLARVHF